MSSERNESKCSRVNPCFGLWEFMFPMNTLVCEYTNTVYQVSLVAGFGRSNMVMDYPQSRTDNTSSQSVVVLSMLIVILLTGRAIYVAISTDATLKGIFILIVYSSTLIFVGFIAGVNASNIRSRKKQGNLILIKLGTITNRCRFQSKPCAIQFNRTVHH